MSTSQHSTNFDGIAVIGMACDFPGASSIEKFWHNLCEGIESIGNFSDNALDSSIPNNIRDNSRYVPARGVLENIEMFAAEFFGINSMEAKVMDPQQRKFLELAWHAIEYTGYDSESYPGLIGVYAGVGINHYYRNNLSYHEDLVEAFGETQILLSNEKDYLTTRVSHKLNLKGPSVNINTACSTSLVAVSHACESLLNYQSDMALAGGVSITHPQNSGYLYKEVNIFSKDGHCRPFDSRSSGTVSSNGLGIVVLKRLEDAIEDGDKIYAVVRGTAINNDGADKMSFMAPSVDGQAEVISMALANANLEPGDIAYIEAHGTATQIGDPIEIEALTKIFKINTEKKNFCALGSVKSNFGHLDAAAGIAGLIKAILAVYHAKIPPSLHYNSPNPNIDFSDSPFFVNRSLSDWPIKMGLRRAGISSFGIGGTNAHVVIEEPPQILASGISRPYQLILLTAKTSSALNSATANLRDCLKQKSNSNLADIAYTLQNGRRKFRYRRILVVKDIQEALTNLETCEKHPAKTKHVKSTNPKVAFLFPGQGVQFLNMGHGLYENEPAFKKTIDECAEILKPCLQEDIRDIIYPKPEQKNEANIKLNQTCFTQPTLFAIEYALANLWMHWGIVPSAMVGHSIGEFTAACLSGVFSLEDALSVVSSRGRLMQDLPPGSMLTINDSVESIKQYLPTDLSIAAVNAPKFCVVSGSTKLIQEFHFELEENKIRNHILNTSHAFHSKMMDPVVTPFKEQIKGIKLSEPKIPFVSTVTGNWISGLEATNPDYWAHQLRTTVLFSDAIKKLWEQNERVLLEVGPKTTAGFLARQHIKDLSKQSVISSCGDENIDKEYFYILNAVGSLFLSGIEINWETFYQNETRHRVQLPGYPFEKKRYWLETPIQKAGNLSKTSHHSIENGDSHDNTKANLIVDKQRNNDTYSSSKFEKYEHSLIGTEKEFELSTNSIEKLLIEIWKNILPEVEHINTNDDFFDLGGHSLLAVQLFSQIKNLTDVDLPLSTLFEAPTIREIALLLEGQFTPKLMRMKGQTENDSVDELNKPESTYLLKDEKSKWSYLIPIQPKGNSPPLFCVHHIGGSVLAYQVFISYLGKEQPIYGLQSKGFNGREKPINDIKTIAENYINEIRQIQPKGPYYLCGHSMGGAIAYELAIQLQKAEEDIAFLALFDTYHPKYLKESRGPLGGSIAVHFEEISQLSIGRKVGYIKTRLVNKLVHALKTWMCLSLYRIKYQLPHSLKDYYVSKIHQNAYLNYFPNIFEGNLTFFSSSLNDTDDDPIRGWGNSINGAIDVVDIPADHFEILEKTELAYSIKEQLLDAQNHNKPVISSNRATPQN